MEHAGRKHPNGAATSERPRRLIARGKLGTAAARIFEVWLMTMLVATMAARVSHSTVWPASTTGSLPVCTAPDLQADVRSIPDGTGGVYVVWEDLRNGNNDVYLQRLTRLGGVWPGWPTDGVAVCTAAGLQVDPKIVADDNGGAIVVWPDRRNGTDFDVYAQRVDRAGVPQWMANGVALSTAIRDQSGVRIASDGAGGAVAAWTDSRISTANPEIYAQRIDPNGTPQWAANGVLVNGATPGIQLLDDVVAGASGSVFVSWTDYRLGANTNIFVQRLTSSGTMSWGATGVQVVSQTAGQFYSRLAHDGTNGVYVVFQDDRMGPTENDLYAQRIGSTGTLLWPAVACGVSCFDAIPVCTIGLGQINPVIAAIDGGVVFAWEDYRPGTVPPNRDVFAQRFTAGGMPEWAVGGIDLASVGGDQHTLSMIHDGDDGVIVAWTDTRNDAGDVYGARVDSTGILAPGWIPDGTPLCTGAGAQASPVLASNGENGAVVSFIADPASVADVRARSVGGFGRTFVEPLAIVPHPDGGSFVAWEEYSGSDADVRLQRFDAAGAPHLSWPMGGVRVSWAAGNEQHPSLCADGAGGVYVAWEDDRAGANNRDIFVQHFTEYGGFAGGWPADGLDIDANINDQRMPQIAPDGLGGVSVVWMTGGGLYSLGAVTVQQVDAFGALRLESPLMMVPLANGPASIASDAAGNLFVAYESLAWADDFFLHRVDPDGTSPWFTEILPTETGKRDPVVAADGTGGAYVAWRGNSGGPPTPSQIRAQHFDATGAVAPTWPAGGIDLCVAAGNQYDAKIASDGVDGAVVAWTDERTAAVPDVYAQRILPLGGVAWTAGGRAIVTGGSEQIEPVLAGDGSGGALVAWMDRRGIAHADVYALRVNADGTNGVGFATGGNLVAQLPATSVIGDQFAVAIATDGAAGANLVWFDTRGGTDIPDARLLHLDAFGIAGDHGLAITRIADVPNDQGGQVLISWRPHVFDRMPGLAIGEYWIWRQLPDAALPMAFIRGATRFEARDPAARPGPGSVIEVEGDYWEFLESKPATGLSGYSSVAATTSDLPGPRPTRFMIQARLRGTLAFWSSAPDSAFSVDNLAPSSPGFFTVQFFSGTAPSGGLSARAASSSLEGGSYSWLHWAPNVEADFVEYRIHRGTTADFEPTGANLIATQSDTGYVDAVASAHYYKLIAVDAHGNSSIASAGAPWELLGVVDRVAVLHLAPALPNPTRGATTFQLSLPRAGDAELDLYDAAGRRVKSLMRGRASAGVHTVRWDGLDDAARPAANGVYFVRLSAGGVTRTTRLTLIR